MTASFPSSDSLPSRSKSFRSRRHARELALQALFQWDIHGGLGDWWEEFWSGRSMTTEAKAFTEQLFYGVCEQQSEIDRLMTTYAQHWTIDRMPVVDRNILREALYELLWIREVPAKVTVNEAIELAKRFADEETKGFINGLLDAVLKHEPSLQNKRLEIEKSEAETSESVHSPT